MNERRDPWRLAGLLAAPAYLALILTLGALEPGFSHLTTPMSVLGGVSGARGLAFNLGVAATGVLVIVFGVGLRRQLPSRSTATVGAALLVIGGMGMMGAGYFHCNEGCRNILADPDLVGRLHIVSSLLAGMGMGLAPVFVWLAMRGSERWEDLVTPTLVAAVLANVPGIVFWMTIATGFRLVSVEGLIQRLGVVVVLLWIFLVAADDRRYR